MTSPGVEMAFRLELTLAWMQLERCLVSSLSAKPVPDGSGLWWATIVPPAPNLKCPLGYAARNACVIASEGKREITASHIRGAKGLVLKALDVYRLESHGN